MSEEAETHIDLFDSLDDLSETDWTKRGVLHLMAVQETTNDAIMQLTTLSDKLKQRWSLLTLINSILNPLATIGSLFQVIDSAIELRDIEDALQLNQIRLITICIVCLVQFVSSCLSVYLKTANYDFKLSVASDLVMDYTHIVHQIDGQLYRKAKHRTSMIALINQVSYSLQIDFVKQHTTLGIKQTPLQTYNHSQGNSPTPSRRTSERLYQSRGLLDAGLSDV